MRPACNIGNLMTFKVIQCNNYPHKRNMEVHRGVVVLRTLAETGYNSALALESNAYFLEFQL